MLITDTQVDELISILVGMSGLDEELVERCAPLVRTERYDEAVGRAFVVLEARMRELLGVSGGSGRNLAQKLFSPKDTQYTARLNLPSDEVEGLGNLFDGAFAAFRNRAAHTVAGYTLEETRAIIHLINLTLLTLEQMKQAPPPQIPPEVAKSLGGQATERLQQFLRKLGSLGVSRVHAKGWMPYGVTLRYKRPSWTTPKPHLVSVFFLCMVKDRPALAFNMPYLNAVPGLDIGQLQKDLLDAGCVRVGTPLRPVQLDLLMHNDQATFDRLYEILQTLIEKHKP